MRVDYIALSIPVFFVLIGVEVLASWRLRRGYYRLNDTVSDLGCGVVQQVFAIFSKLVVSGGYVWIYEHARLFTIPEASALAWVGLFVGVDFFYYWFHRVSHEVNLLWAAHVVHHQSEEYNLAVALRQSAFQPLFSWVFYLPLAWLGFSPLTFAAMVSFNTIYQFWIHTRFVPKLGPLEWFLNTPSHHRVHHGRNPEYIDRNHGGTLIIWDRLFGTFEEEKADVVYGVTEPLASFNPVWANFHPYRDLVADTRRASGLTDKIGIWLRGPGWRPVGSESWPKRSITLDAPKHDRRYARGLAAYALVHLALALVAAVVVLDLRGKVSWAEMTALSSAVLLSFGNLGGLLDGRAWAKAAEVLRLALVAIAVLAAIRVYALALPIALIGAALALLSIVWLSAAARAAHSSAGFGSRSTS